MYDDEMITSRKYTDKDKEVPSGTDNKGDDRVLCGASAYEEKYFFNEKYSNIPDSIKDELHVICVLFTQEVGGIITFSFDEEGDIYIETRSHDEDIYYDDIGSGLLVREIQRKRRDLLESLTLYYRVMVLGESL